MDLDRWKKLDSLLQSVLARPPENRPAYLREICAGDEALERELRSLREGEEPHAHARGRRELAGQLQAYVVQQLTEFKSGARSNDRAHVMRAVAARLTDEEMRAVAEYLAGLR